MSFFGGAISFIVVCPCLIPIRFVYRNINSGTLESMTCVRDLAHGCTSSHWKRERGVHSHTRSCCCFSLIKVSRESWYSSQLVFDEWRSKQVPGSHERFAPREGERESYRRRTAGSLAHKPNGYLITPFGKWSAVGCWWRWNFRVMLWLIKWSEFLS